MSYNAWLYVYANPANLTDPSGHDPWWCENQNNPKLCYAKWNLEHTGTLTSDILKTYYDWSPVESLYLLQSYFNIKLPSGISYRFAYSGHGIFEDERIGGQNPWFFDERHQNDPVSIYVLEYGMCRYYSSTIPNSLTDWDNAIYVTSGTFESFNFYPDDVAGTMMHEAVHAWQEDIALQQIGTDVLTWADRNSEYYNGIERQAYQAVLDMNGSRLELSQNNISRMKTRRDSTYGSGKDSPLILPVGMP